MQVSSPHWPLHNQFWDFHFRFNLIWKEGAWIIIEKCWKGKIWKTLLKRAFDVHSDQRLSNYIFALIILISEKQKYFSFFRKLFIFLSQELAKSFYQIKSFYGNDSIRKDTFSNLLLQVCPMLSCYHVTMLSWYNVIMLQCYHGIMLSCYNVIMV